MTRLIFVGSTNVGKLVHFGDEFLKADHPSTIQYFNLDTLTEDEGLAIQDIVTSLVETGTVPQLTAKEVTECIAGEVLNG
jgi:hypothetical protein